MADKSQAEAVKALHSWGWAERNVSPVPQKLPNGKTVYRVPGNVGRPDLMVQKGVWGAHIEVKTAGLSFSFAEWRSDQRKWAWKNGYRHNLWFWLTMGIDPPTYNPDAYAPRMTWLFPYPVMLQLLGIFRPIQKSLPYRDNGRLEIRNQRLWASSLLSNYELKWNSGVWSLPDAHPFPVQETTRHAARKNRVQLLPEAAQSTFPTEVSEELRGLVPA